MKISVKLFGKATPIEIDSNETIGNLKKLIEKSQSVKMEQQRLVYGKKPLDDDTKTLGYYRIKPDSIVYLMIRLYVIDPNGQNQIQSTASKNHSQNQSNKKKVNFKI